MNLLDFAPSLFGFLLVFLRCSALFSLAPIVGSQAVPVPIRVTLALPVAFTVFIGAGAPAFLAWQSPGALIGAAAAETLVGLCAGAGAKFAVEAAYAAGHLASTAMGLGFGSMLDPFEGTESTAIAELFGILALGAVMAAGGHREMVVWLLRSEIYASHAHGLDLAGLCASGVANALTGIALAVRLAYPVLASVLIAQVALGLLGRAAPQLSIASLGFSISIMAGGGVLYVIAPQAAELVARATIRSFTGGG